MNIIIFRVMSSEGLFDKNKELIFGTLLGAMIGGVINYLITTKSLKKERHIKLAIENKEKVYTPLLMELKTLSDYIEDNESINFNTSVDEISKAYNGDSENNFIKWNIIKNSYLYYQIRDRYVELLEEISNLITAYQKYKEEIQDKMIESLKVNFDDDFNYVNGMFKDSDDKKGIFKEIETYYESFKEERSEENYNKIKSDIETIYNESEFESKKQLIQSKIKVIIDLLENEIKKISDKYEGKNKKYL
jgi:gas vesicle protein